MASLLRLLLLGVLALGSVGADLVQVQVLARHGLRNTFQRTEIEVWDDGGLLSGHGYGQMAAIGGAFHDRYQGGAIKTAWNATDLPQALMARSTDSLPSMMSATAFMLGLVPPGSGPVDELTGKAALPGQLDLVGVHTVPMPLDIPLRAYDKCPKFIDALDSLMNSTEIRAWEAQNRDLLTKLGNHTQTNVTAGTYLDAFEIVAVEHAFGKLGEITDTEYTQFEKLAWFLSGKMFTGADTNRMLAGRLLANMAQQIAAAVDVNNVTIPFVYLSGQYPTIMATYSSLGVYGATGGIPTELPSPGAALILELHRESEKSFNVRVLVHDPSRGRNFQEITLDQCGGVAMCPLDKFMSQLTISAIPMPEDWCALCNNTVTPPCSTGQTVEVPVPGPCSPVPSDPNSGDAGTQVVVGADGGRSAAYAIVTGVGLGFLLATLLYAIIRCAKSRVLQDRLLPRIQDAWAGRGTRTPNHVELQA